LKGTRFEKLIPAFKKMKGDVILSNGITEDDGAPEEVYDVDDEGNIVKYSFPGHRGRPGEKEEEKKPQSSKKRGGRSRGT
jgi:hypothetical protein